MERGKRLENATAYRSEWFTILDVDSRLHSEGCTSLMDYPNQIKVLISVESGVTTINSLDSSAIGRTKGFTMFSLPTNDKESELHLIRRTQTEEEPVVRLSLPSRDISNSALQSMSHRFFGALADDEIPEWFNNTSTSNPISIPIGDKKWEGVATCAVFSVNNTTADVDFSNYWYQITVETDVMSLEPFVVDHRELYGRVRPSSDLRLIYFEPSKKFPKIGLKASTVVRARFETNNPFVVVQKCGIHLAYEQDAGLLFTNEYWGKCFTWKNNLVLLSGWVSRGGYMFELKFIPPSEEDYSTHVLRKNIESVLPRYLEASNHSICAFKFNLSGSPAWFHEEFELHSQKYRNWD
ncbi:hypothetical protein M0R45_027678 [Rubus argutus]|uniref:C-JID domain-containing protein n=1 Tax=Rubus argutus TaxID=59490 RepID=A0AAW1X4U8_RUBAR